MSSRSDRRLVWIVLALLAVLFVLPVLGMTLGWFGGPMMGGGFGPGMWDGGRFPVWVLVVGAVVQFLFLAALAGVGYLIYRSAARGGDGGRALEELRVAYARGELTDEEYESRRERLEEDR